MKLSRSEWKPWPIDVIFQHFAKQQKAAQKAAQEAAKAKQQEEQQQLAEAALSRHTESAVGEGLSCVGGSRTDSSVDHTASIERRQCALISAASLAGSRRDGRGDATMEEAEGVRAEVPEATSSAECRRGARKRGRRGLAAELWKCVGKWIQSEDADRIPAGKGGTGKCGGRFGETCKKRRKRRVGEGKGENYSRKQEEGDGKDSIANAYQKVKMFVEWK